MHPREAWTIGSIAGIPIRVHFTWIFALVYLTVIFSSRFQVLAAAADVEGIRLLLPPLAWGLLLTLALFACVTLHEFAHVAVARRGGGRVHGVTLMMLGGVSEIGEVERPALERKMAFAGPLASFGLALFFYLLFRVGAGGPPDLRFGLFYMAQINVVLGVFNLLPAYPMDGGRILRSFLVARSGEVRATQIAAGVGKAISVALVVLGILGGNWWLLLIALFLFLGGEAESRGVQARAALRGLRVGDFFVRRVATVEPEATVEEAVAGMLQERTRGAVVVAGGRPIGVVTAAMLAHIPVRERSGVPVSTFMRPGPMVSIHDPLPAVVSTLQEQQLDAVGVVDGDELVGTLALEDIARGLQLRELTRAPAA